MKKDKLTWEEGMMKLLTFYTEAVIAGDKKEAISCGQEMVKIGKTLDTTQKFLSSTVKNHSHLN